MLHSALHSASSQGGILLTVAKWHQALGSYFSSNSCWRNGWLQLQDQGGTCLTLILIYHQKELLCKHEIIHLNINNKVVLMTNQHQSKIHACLPRVLACSSTHDTGITSYLDGWYCQQLLHNQICFYSQHVPSHHVNFHGPTKSRRGTVLLMPYPQESFVSL